MIIWLSIVSFFLDGILSRYISPNSLFLPLFTIVSLVIIYPYFNDNARYFKYIAIMGLLYDIAYMDLLFYNCFIFVILGFVNIFIQYLLSNSVYINVMISTIIIILYRISNFIYANIVGYVSCKDLFVTIYSSLLLNIIYCIILYNISDYFSKKYKILKNK